MRGIGVRIQYDDKAMDKYGNTWDTTTVRMSRESGARTEFEKRQYAIKHNYLFPHWAVHGYVVSGVLRSCAFCKTVELIQAVADGHGIDRTTQDEETKQWAKFRAVSWDWMEEQDLFVYRLDLEGRVKEEAS